MKLMKKFFKIILISLLFNFLSFLVGANLQIKAAPGCFPPNSWTGLCDSGFTCPQDSQMYGFCCDTLDECNNSSPPPGNQFICVWNGSNCVVGAHNCDPNSGGYPNPSFCSQSLSQADCQGKIGNCVANPQGVGQVIFCDPEGKPIARTSDRIYTAIGCIPVDNTTKLIAFFLGWAIGIAGVIAFFLILFAGLQIIISRGDPEGLKAGKNLLTSAITGLILIIFSVFLLKLIGVNLFQIPGL